MRRRHPATGILAAAAALGVWLAAPVDAQDVAAAAATARTRPTVVFEHDAKDTAGFTLYVRPSSGEELRIDLGALRPDGKGRITVPLPALPKGVYAFDIAAYNASGESPRVPASPATLELTSDLAVLAPEAKPRASDATHAHDAGQTPPPPKTETGQAESEKKGGGFLGRVWKGVVGN